MQPRTLENYIEQADDLAQEIVNAWGINVHREIEQDAKIEKLARESFAIAYKYYWEKHALVF